MDTLPLGLYLWRRLQQVGISTIMGVPGDFNLELLDYIYEVTGLRWVGTANELNAAYAVDGYARTKSVPGCLVTTHGVGELSALNGIAGSMTEQVKVIHVVGQTSRDMQENNVMIHHSIGSNPDHQIFNKASTAFRCAAAELYDIKTAPAEIDRVIRTCFVKSQPVYIFLPRDMVHEQVPAGLLDKPVDLSLPDHLEDLDTVVSSMVGAIDRAESPAIFVDCLVHRHGALAELRQLVDKLRIPVYATTMAKGSIDEDHPCYVGVYNGSASRPGVSEAFQEADLVLLLGDLPADTNTGGFSRKLEPARCIEVQPAKVIMRGDNVIPDVHLKTVLRELVKHVSPVRESASKMPSLPPIELEEQPSLEKITQSWVWERIARFLQPGDVVFGDTGTALFGMATPKFPKDILWQSQTYYGSIGFAPPAGLGAELALEDMCRFEQGARRRTVVIVGDGAFQLTAQELGTMIAYGTKAVIFIINNDGYTIERIIHGARQKYNDISPWDLSHALKFFGMSDDQAEGSFFRARTREELDSVLSKHELQNPSNVMLVEIFMDKMDVPTSIIDMVKNRGPEAIKYMKDAGFKVE